MITTSPLAKITILIAFLLFSNKYPLKTSLNDSRLVMSELLDKHQPHTKTCCVIIECHTGSRCADKNMNQADSCGSSH